MGTCSKDIETKLLFDWFNLVSLNVVDGISPGLTVLTPGRGGGH